MTSKRPVVFKASGWKEYVYKKDSAPLSKSESDIINDIVTSTKGVYYTKRQSTVIKSNGVKPHKWEVLGFKDYDHYAGWTYFNGLYYNESDDHMLGELLGGA